MTEYNDIKKKGKRTNTEMVENFSEELNKNYKENNRNVQEQD